MGEMDREMLLALILLSQIDLCWKYCGLLRSIKMSLIEQRPGLTS